jgi:glycosyltransferase involved in cell wall biosynthesis
VAKTTRVEIKPGPMAQTLLDLAPLGCDRTHSSVSQAGMKHVWILNHYAQRPTDTGGLTRHHSLARHLPANGWRATIVAASTAHPSGRQRPAIETSGPDQVEGVSYLWLHAPEYSGNGIDRIRNMLAYGWRAAFSPAMSKLDRPDAIIGSSPHPAAALAGALLARRRNVPFLFEVRDLWPQALIDMGRIKAGGGIARAMLALERHLFRASARPITLWPNVGAYMRDHGIDGAEPAWIPNGIDLAIAPSPLPDTSKFTLMYLGAHGGANGLDNVVRAMRIVQDYTASAHIRLRLVGDGPDKPRLRALAAELGVKNVAFEDPVPKHQVQSISGQADAFVFNLIDAPMFRYGISPNKLYEYMAAQRPVIFCCEAFNDPVAESGGGVSVAPGRPDLLADAIMRLAATPRERRAEMAAAARRYVEARHSFDRLAADLAHVLNACVAGGR